MCYAAAEYVFGISQTQFPSGVEALDVDAEKLEIEGIAIPANGNVRSRSIVSVGQPIPGVDIRIGASLPEGHVGEVNIRGPALCSGYFRNEETTNEKFVDGWYRSGDLGFLANGHLYITGRMDDLIIVRGKNIYAHDIEEVASRSNGVKDGRTIAFGIEDGSGTQQLVLAIETSGEIESRPLKAEINDRINASFGIVPYDIVAVQPNSLVKTTSGKISRSENRRRYIDKGFDVAP